MAFTGVGRTAVGASRSLHALRAAVCAPLWLSCHRGIGQALRAVWSVSGLRPVMWCVPPPTLVLRRCAASALRAGLPVRPPWGLPQPARLLGRLCYKFCSLSRTEYGGYRPKRPVSQRDRWLTFSRSQKPKNISAVCLWSNFARRNRPKEELWHCYDDFVLKRRSGASRFFMWKKHRRN